MGRETGLPKIGLSEHFDGSEGHGDAGLHIEDAGSSDATIGHTPGHGAEGSNGPDGIEMTEQENRVSGGRSRRGFGA
jgi:hypothetical protein